EPAPGARLAMRSGPASRAGPPSAPAPAPGPATPDAQAQAEAADLSAVDPLDQEPGTISARLDLEGVAGDPASRTGRGEIEIRDARMYRVPGALAALQLLNLTLSVSRS